MKFTVLAAPLGVVLAGQCSDPNPCNNDGTCVPNMDSYTCECKHDINRLPLFVGVQCEFPNPCREFTCSGHGTCSWSMQMHNPIKAERPSAHCECKVGFDGEHCEVTIGCGQFLDENPCGSHGKCETDVLKEYTCKCHHGYTGERCMEIDHCANHPCDRDEICQNGKVRSSCEKNISCDRHPCKNGGNCVIEEASYKCDCTSGWHGHDCSIASTETCDAAKCHHGTCIANDDGKLVCKCQGGFSGVNCDINIDECENHECQHGATCQDKVRGYECLCTSGWKGRLCDEDVNECETSLSNICENGGSCLNFDGSYTCSCINGFSGNNCQNNFDDCANHDCAPGSECEDQQGQYRCNCKDGMTGRRCDKVNECYKTGLRWKNPCGDTSNKCDPDEDGKPVCSCSSGWTGNRCEQDVNECDYAQSPCAVDRGTCNNTPGSYYCECAFGYEGDFCDEDRDFCATTPCFNGGTCMIDLSKSPNGYTCSCTEGHEGPTCEEKKKNCSKQTCMNGGTCIERSFGFDCQCQDGYKGKHCENQIDHCKSNNWPCDNGGTCENEINRYECLCKPGWTGKNCTDNIDDCKRKPCKHGKCTDFVNDYNCECEDGWKGVRCDMEVNKCDPNPCYNTGKCKIPEPGKFKCVCPKGTSGIRCEHDEDECEGVTCLNGGYAEDHIGKCVCKCKPGFEGEFCQNDINDCDDNSCYNGGKCEDRVDGFLCKCPSGTFGTRCFSENRPCSPNPCGMNGDCRETFDTRYFECSCYAGYEGKLCDQDACADNGLCQNGGESRPAGASGTNSKCQCLCPLNFSGVHCEISIACKSHDPCDHGICISDDGENRRCVCNDGWTGDKCDTSTNECGSHVCHNGGKCQNNYDNRAICDCSPGWVGSHCDIDVDECEDYDNLCKNDSKCINTDGSYKCECVSGFKGKNCDMDINDCAHKPCKNGGSCINNTSGRGFTCDCQDGFTGIRCEEEVDECASNPCLNNGKCEDMVNSFHCSCGAGFHGERCETRRSVCDEAVCLNNGSCHEVVYGSNKEYTCQCINGFEGDHCEDDIDDCASEPCLNKGKCIDLVGDYKCECRAAFTGPDCQVLSRLCSSNNPCQNEGDCIDDNNKVGYRCQCLKTHEGLHCDIPLWSCLATANFLKLSENQVCKNGGKCHEKGRLGHSCSCEDGFTGDHCETEVDLCESKDCHNGGKCVVHTPSQYQPYPTCDCLPAWGGESCLINRGEQICASNPCQNFGTCYVTPLNIDVAYKCQCLRGTTGVHCEINENNCDDVQVDSEEPCRGSGQCMDGQTKETLGSFLCRCNPGFTGERCGAKENFCKRGLCDDVGTAYCVPKINDFECECKDGYSGDRCDHYEMPSNPCLEEDPVCMNGAQCTQALYTEAGFKCHCTESGTYGERCEERQQSCGDFLCYHSTSCTSTGECSCEPGWRGPSCAIPTTPKDCPKDISEMSTCSKKCNTQACDYCNGTCSLGLNPWDQCPHEECKMVFNNGACDAKCNIEECMFDGRDCEKEPELLNVCPFEDYCANRYKDGVCDPGCNIPACAWDGLDCDDQTQVLAIGEITLVINCAYQDVESDNEFQLLVERSISQVLHSTVIIRDIVDTNEAVEHSLPNSRRKRAASPGTDTKKFSFVVDNRGCLASELSCYYHAEYVTKDIAAQKQQGGLAIPWFKLDEVGYQENIEKTFPRALITTVGGLLIVTIIFGILSRKRKKGILWGGMGPIGEGPPSKRQKPQQQMPGWPMALPDGCKKGVKSAYSMYGSPPYSLGQTGNIYQPKPGTSIGANDWTYGIATEDQPMLPYASTEPPNILSQKGPDGQDILHIMARNDINYTDEDIIATIDTGVPLNNQTDTYEETPLHYAARYFKASMAKHLLQRGADPTIKDKHGRTPLHVAISSDAKGVFYVLLQNPHGINFDEKDEDGSTPLITAAKFAIEWGTQELISQNVDVNMVDNKGKSALHWAAEVNNSTTCEFLLKHGANKDLQTEREETPLFLAAREGAIDCVNVLVHHMAAKDTADIKARKPEDIAAQRGHDDVVQLLKQVTPSLYIEGSFQPCPSKNHFYQKKMGGSGSKKRSRPDPKNSKANKRVKPIGGRQVAYDRYQPHTRSIPTLPGYNSTGSTSLTPPNERHNFSFQTLHNPSRLQHSQAIHAYPHHQMQYALDMNQTMPCSPYNLTHKGAYDAHAAWTVQQMTQFSYHGSAYPLHRSYQSPTMHQIQQTSMTMDPAVQRSPEYQSNIVDNELPDSILTPSPESNWSSPPAAEVARGLLTPGAGHGKAHAQPQWLQNATYSPGLNHPKQQATVGQY